MQTESATLEDGSEGSQGDETTEAGKTFSQKPASIPPYDAELGHH